MEMKHTIQINLAAIVVNDLARLFDQTQYHVFEKDICAKNLTSWTPDSKTPKVDGYVIC